MACVYDFDGTVYDGDSSVDFYLFELKKHPEIAVMLPKQCFGVLMLKLGIWKKEKGKSFYFSFLKMIKNPENDVSEFWDKNISKIKHWYKIKHDESDIFISASPLFLVGEAAKRTGTGNVIASECDIHTGKYLSFNCYGEEKPKTFAERYPDTEIDEFYSDSPSDTPMAMLAKKSYFVSGEKISIWEIK